MSTGTRRRQTFLPGEKSMTTSCSKSSLATRANTWTVAQIVREYGVSRSVIARYEREGIFPKPVEWNPHLGTKTYLRYDRQEVAELMETYTEYKKTDAVELKIKLTQDEIDSIRLAARKVYLHPDRYMSEVLLNHAKKIHDADAKAEEGTF